MQHYRLENNMALKRPTLSGLMIQRELNKFYAHPMAQLSTGLVLTILATSFFALAAIKPTLETMAGLLKEIDDKRTIDQQLTTKISALATAQSELSTKGESAKVLLDAVPTTPDLPTLLKMMEKLATEHTVTFTSMIIPQIPTERDPNNSGVELESIPVSVTFSGSYQELSALLSDIENLQRVIVIDRIDIVPTTDTNQQTLSMAVTMRAFAFALTAPVKTATTPL
ncbi:hypothetical protein C5B42_02235 [Candidatus Cerribacteria bacterium 'Amazon FNV 2010 28 9']|uniref:Pilus assembly protein PilO n=1 Tax=Candidatus Cerribacteria bacterium 'Amazon FNV 2010 28 9' TaxID=2081795 RepID=A0A317JPA4_9BACT|nr:MAG: hypothetical protein C5B42_02235 [Candidatus Cerribacteria bacterium 'Amazon FNV 2010 28 9']